jgi:excinuclease UvrABC nuclease subunit
MNAEWESLFDGSLTLTATQTESNTLAELPARRGVLLFTDSNRHPIQLLQTANLRGLSRSRLAEVPPETPHRKANLGAITQKVFYACCDNDLQRHLLYQRLTHAVFGKQWKKWIALPRRDYAAIERGRRFPFFQLTNAVEPTQSTELFGPFPNRRAAAQFCESLNTAFELCRNPALLDSGTPQSCPYRQMQSCHGLCCQEHGQAEYTALVEKALRCAEGNIAEAVDDLERQMKEAAAN